MRTSTRGGDTRRTVTVGTAELPAAWLEQTAPTGRLVAPVRIAGSATRSIAFERDGNQWSSVDSQLCGFMPLRASVAADPRRIVQVTDDGAVKLWVHREQDVDVRALNGVFDTPAHEQWAGVAFGKTESLDPMWLWLACALPNALSRMPVERHAIEAGLIAPMLGWGCMATVEGDSLAYLTMRPTSDARDEIGVIGHGPRGRSLAETMSHEITAWSSYRSQPIGFEFHPHGIKGAPAPGRFVINRRSGVFTVTWQA
jgi:protein-L-isoaspartate(D-aspartate) O-methyltransferase